VLSVGKKMEIQENDDVGLLDMLIVVAQNLKLLVFGPLLAGLIALGASYLQPASYVSQAIVAPPGATAAQAASLMTSPLVLDPVVTNRNLAQGQSPQTARERFEKQVKATVGKDGLLRLEVTATSPTEAQTLGNAIIDSWLQSTLPGEQERQDLEKRLAYAQSGLASTTALLERMASDGTGSLNKTTTRGEVGTSLVSVGELQAKYLADVLSIPRTLQGLTRDVVKQAPTLPTEAAAPKKGLIATMASLAAAGLLMLWIFARQAWNSVAQDPGAAAGQRRLRNALGRMPGG
jgi:hypothetical protein